MPWKKIGEGAYNKVYKNSEETLVLKILQDQEDKTDTPQRSVRLWKEINPDLPPAHCYEDPDLGAGWTAPYISGVQSTDDEIMKALIGIYNRTGRIITDAVSKNNFITTLDGKVVCIDIGMALNMEQREYKFFDESTGRKRRNSTISLDAWKNLEKLYGEYFDDYERIYPTTVQTIKALLYIKSNRPDIYNADFLLGNAQSLELLSSAYDIQSKNKVDDNNIIKEANRTLESAEDLLRQQRDLSLNPIKESCIENLNRYILSRGNIQSGTFKASTISRLFRNTDAVTYKANEALKTIERIRQASSIKEIDDIIMNAQQSPELKKSRSDLTSCLGRCKVMTQIALQEEPKPNISPKL